MTHEKRLWIAVAISMALVIIWNILFPPPKPQKPAEQDISGIEQTGDTAEERISSQANIDSDSVDVLYSEDPYSEDPNDRRDVESRTERIPPQRIGESIKRDFLNGTAAFAETGGVMTSFIMRDYTYKTISDDLVSVSLVDKGKDEFGHFAVMMEDTDRSGLSRMTWSLNSSKQSGERGPALFQTSPTISELPQGVILEKRFEESDLPFASEFEFRVTNKTAVQVAFSTGRLEYPLQGTSSAGSFLLHLGPGLGMNTPASVYRSQYDVTGAYEVDGKMNTATVEESWYHGIIGSPDEIRDAEWVALQNRYFAVALLPQGFKVDANFSYGSDRRLGMWILLPAFQLDPGGSRSFKFKVFSGPKRTELLTKFSKNLRPLDGMEPSVFPSQVAFARWMVDFLGKIESRVGNWGYSIIILTIIIRVLLFPLSHYQFKSMAKMSKLKPKIDKIQSQYADDKERLQRELMNVYREAGVNPLGGCLPIFVQMPILIGLFLALQNSIELRGAEFALWIKDLAIPDTILSVVGIPINPLPIAMGATMIIQQKITPTPTADPNQKQMFMIMTIVMTVMFYNFPSGLSLYWLTQNILSIAQQYYMLKRKED